MKSIIKTFNKSSNKSSSKSASFNRPQSGPQLNPGELPFKPTIRLQINLPHNQLMVLRLMPDTILSEIKQMICTEKSFDPGKYLLVKPFKSGQTPQLLELDKSLNFYHINEVTVLSNKAYQELSKQFSASNCNQFTSSMYDEDSNRLGGQVDLSQSTPNIAAGMYKRSLSETHSRDKQDGDNCSIRTARSYKRKPAPPPPLLKAAKSMQNLAPIRDEEEERPSSEVFSSFEHHNDSSSLSEHSTTTEAAKVPPESVVTTQPSKQHHQQQQLHHHHHHRLSRQNSGSDSSGYHEMLSHTETDNSTPTNSPAPPVSPNPSESPSTSLVSNKPPPVPSQRTSLSTKPSAEHNGKGAAPDSPGSATSATATSSKKRRAPAPPPPVASAATAPPSVTEDSTQSTSAPPSPRVVKSPSADAAEPSTSRLSISSKGGNPPVFETSPRASSSASSSSSSGLEDSKMSSLSDTSLSPIVVVKSSGDSGKSIAADIDDSINPTLNSTEIPQTGAQPVKETDSKLDQTEVIESKDESSKTSESSTAALQPPEETGKVVSPDAKPVEQPKVEKETAVQQQHLTEPVEPDQKKSTDQQPATGMSILFEGELTRLLFLVV